MRSWAGGELLFGENPGSGPPIPSILHVQNSPLHIHCPRLPHPVLTMGDSKSPILPLYRAAHLPCGSIHLLDSPRPGSPCRIAAKIPWKTQNAHFCPSSRGGWDRGSHPGGFWGLQVPGAAVTPLSFPACCSYEAGILENPKVMDHGHPGRAGGVPGACSLIGNFTAPPHPLAL